MKKLILFLALFTGTVIVAQTGKSKSTSTTKSSEKESKQYKSAETGRYVTKAQAENAPKTTYSTKRKK